MGNLNTLDSVSGIVGYFQLVIPPYFTKDTNSFLYSFLTGLGTMMKIGVDQINELYDKTKLYLASGDDVDYLITDYVALRRKNSESDENYIDRFIKRVYRYNITTDSISDQVYDIFGEYPTKLYELNGRSGYWGLENYENDSAKHWFYDNSGDNTVFWGGELGQGAYKGYIYLTERPPNNVLIELCQVLNSNRMLGTDIYLVYPGMPYTYGDAAAVYGEATYS
jgi:hypothetical protein